MSRKILITFFAILAVLTTAAHAGRGIGVGVIIGEPTGLSYKHWLGGNTAIDGAVSWAIDNGEDWETHMDLLYHNASIGSANGARLPLYYGIGGRVVFASETRYGVRLPLGAVIMPSTVPIDLFGEVVPIFDISPSSDFTLNLAIGARLYF